MGCKHKTRRIPWGGGSSMQPSPQGLLGVQNGDVEKTLANSGSGDRKLANHKTSCHFETIKISTHNCCLPGSSPRRNFERREDPGNEVRDP